MTQFSINPYLNIRMAHGPRFFSDGARVAFLTNITGIPQVWQVALPPENGAPLWPDQVTFATDRVMGVACSPVPGDGRLLYARDTGGNEKAQLFLLDPATGHETALTAGYEAAMHLPGEWSRDGARVLFAANRRDPGLFDAYVQPLVDGEARMIWQNDTPGYLRQMRFSPDGTRAVTVRMSGSFDCELFEIDLAAGEARQLTSAAEPVVYDQPCYAPDGRSLYVFTDRDADFLYIARLDLESLTWETVVQSRWDVDELEPSPDGRYLAYTVNAGGPSELYLLDLETRETRPAPRVDDAPGMVFNTFLPGLAFAPDSARLAFAYSSATRTSDIYLWDLESDRVRPVTRSSHGGLPVESFVVPELIEYPTFDRDALGQPRRIPAWFYRPPGAEGPVPVVVVVHGGPEAQSRPNFYRFYIQLFARLGYAVLVPNVRGSTGYGKPYHHLDDARQRMDSVADLAHAAHWLREQPGIDGDRIAVFGGSYGGFMVLAALTHYPDLWVAGVDIVGISNLVTFLENTSDYRRAHREAEYGTLAEDRDFLEEIAPINHVDRITAPLMVIHGANDPRVPLSEAEQVVASLEARGVPVEFLVFDDEGHGVVKLKNKQVMYPAVVAFLAKHLSAEE